ncbi:membrane glycoprotein [Gordil virus]|uniref:Envelopment polyprotein n=1 Tax=Gordil virus TaxID=1460451 RepID=W8JJ12_9VIRU|nr:membrane glycoprotein [Gordil virus]AHK60928.1 membrane glycoprotein [Gordil virus]
MGQWWLFYFGPNLFDVTCHLLYFQTCAPWKIQSDPLLYPFFVNNYDQYSILEATKDTTQIITEETSVCELSTSSSTLQTCGQQSTFIKKDCSGDIRAIFYINLNAKLEVVTCKKNEVLAKTCNFCIKKSGEVSPVLYKPVQDAFCQQGGSSKVISVRYSKDLCAIGGFRIKSCDRSFSRFEKMPFVVLGQKKIYLESLKMRSRQELLESQFACFKVKESGQNGEFERVSPSMCKGVTTASTKKCSGDEYFCNHFPCETANPEAHCFIRKHSATVEVNINGLWIKPKCIGYEMVAVKRINLRVEEISQRECTSCLWECNKNEILIKTHGPKITSGVACSHGSCKSVSQQPSTFFKIDYPGNSNIIGGKIGIHMTEETSPSNIHLTIQCEKRESCEASDCLFCRHGLLNYQCHTVASALILSVLLSGVLASVIFMLSRSARAVRIMTSALTTPLRWVCLVIKWVMAKWKASIQQRVRRTNEAIGWERRDVEAAPVRRGVPNRYVFYGATILSLLTVVDGCSESVIADSQIMSCTTDGSTTNCKASGISVLQLGPIGSESCIILKGLQSSEKHFISIKTISSELVCKEGESFWTTLYTPVCLSSRRCHLMGDCTGDNCLKWKHNETSMEFAGRTHAEVINENKCFEQGGGWGYGCFNVNPSCLFVHSYLKPVYKHGFKVFKCSAWNHRIKLHIRTPKQDYDLSLMALSTQPTEWGTIGLVLEAEGITGTNSYSFMRHGSGSYAIIDEEYSMEPRKGFLGEVRCPTEESAVRAMNFCKVAPNLIEYQPETDIVECRTSMIDPLTVFNRGSLPQVRGRYTFSQSIEKTTVQAMTTGVIRASVRLNFDEYDIQFVSTKTNCDSTFNSLTGCYSCDEGAKLCVKIKTAASAIYHLVSNDGSINMIKKVEKDANNLCSVFHFNKPVVEIEASYDCGGESKPMMIKGTLVAIAPHDDRITEGGSSIVINPKSKGIDLMAWLSGLSSWMGGPIKTILTIIGLLLLGFVICVLSAYLIKFILWQALNHKKKN